MFRALELSLRRDVAASIPPFSRHAQISQVEQVEAAAEAAADAAKATGASIEDQAASAGQAAAEASKKADNIPVAWLQLEKIRNICCGPRLGSRMTWFQGPSDNFCAAEGQTSSSGAAGRCSWEGCRRSGQGCWLICG